MTIECSELTQTDLEDCCVVVASAFVRNEPLTAHLGITEPEMLAFTRTFAEQTIGDRLSIVCRDTNGLVVGGCLTRDFTTEVDFGEVSAKFQPIMELLDRLFSQEFPPERVASIPRGHAAELFLTGTRPDHAGKGAGRALIQAVSSWIAARGYAYSVCVSTSPITQRVRQQHGFTLLRTLSYPSFRHEGEAVFADLDLSRYGSIETRIADGACGAALFTQAHTQR